MKIDIYADEYIYTHWMDAPGAVDATARVGYIADEDVRQIRKDIVEGVVDGDVAAIAAALLSRCVELSAKGEW